MKHTIALAVVATFAAATFSWALPIEEINGELHAKDRFYSVSAAKGREVIRQYVIQGIMNASQCAAGSITLQASDPQTPAMRVMVIIWPKDETIAAQFCGLKALLPLKSPLVTITGNELEKTIYSRNGKAISSSTPIVHIIPSALKIDREDTR